MPTTFSLVYYACAVPGLGRRAVKRLGRGDTKTQFDGLLNAEAVRLDGPAEFQHVSRGFMKGEGAFGAVLVEGSDGSRRFPLPTDFILPSSPVAPVAPAAMPAAVVSVSLPSAAGDLLLIARIRSQAAGHKVRSSDVAEALGTTKEAVKAAIATTDSGVKMGKFGFLELLPAEASNPLLD
jgi:hypothetical protein